MLILEVRKIEQQQCTQINHICTINFRHFFTSWISAGIKHSKQMNLFKKNEHLLNSLSCIIKSHLRTYIRYFHIITKPFSNNTHIIEYKFPMSIYVSIFPYSKMNTELETGYKNKRENVEITT